MPPQIADKRDAVFTWADYRSWPDEERWEIIGGVAYAMSPAPSTKHQSVGARMYSRLERGLEGKPCRPFIAPTDVKLSDRDVVQPDILVVCDPARITPTHIEGAPDVVIEVLSPATSAKDLRQKKALYERAGVREYLVVDPLEHYAIRFLLGADGFDKGTVFAADEMVVFATLEDLEIPLWEVLEVDGPTMEKPAPGANENRADNR
jgi:Uma2 family endonuclease